MKHHSQLPLLLAILFVCTIPTFGVKAVISSSEDLSGQRQLVSSQLAKAPSYPGEYGEQAVANLTAWRAGILRRTIQWHAANPTPWGHRSHKAPARMKWVGKSRAELFKPFITCPPGMPLTRLKPPKAWWPDTGKWMCADADLKKGPCTAYSLGSRGDYKFETDMLEATACDIHTFDCTWKGKSLDPKRHTYHEICIGKNSGNPKYKPLEDVRKMLGHDQVDVLKVDIEGWEADLLQDWTEQDNLPRQVLMEAHFFQTRGLGTVGEMSLLFAHTSMLGYGIIGMENNPRCLRCFEVGLLRVEGPTL